MKCVTCGSLAFGEGACLMCGTPPGHAKCRGCGVLARLEGEPEAYAFPRFWTIAHDWQCPVCSGTVKKTRRERRVGDWTVWIATAPGDRVVLLAERMQDPRIQRTLEHEGGRRVRELFEVVSERELAEGA